MKGLDRSHKSVGGGRVEYRSIHTEPDNVETGEGGMGRKGAWAEKGHG